MLIAHETGFRMCMRYFTYTKIHTQESREGEMDA